MSLKNAPFQRNQLARYVKRLSENFQIYNIYLVILPQLYGNSKSIHSRNLSWLCCKIRV